MEAGKTYVSLAGHLRASPIFPWNTMKKLSSGTEGFYFSGYRSAGWMSATGRMCLCQWLGINRSFRHP